MHVVVLAREAQLAALVKERLDRRKMGLTQTVRIEDASAAERAVRELKPSALLLVGNRLDTVALAVCQRLGQNPATNRVPLIIAAEQATEAERIAALDAGADGIVQPVDLDAIEWRLRASYHRTNIRQAFQGRGLDINAEGSTVSVSGQPVLLTAREMMVLRVLVHKRTGVVSRGELEQGIWGGTRSRTLDVHVARLRKKLGPAGRRIRTVAKVGYRYVESSENDSPIQSDWSYCKEADRL